MGIVYKAYDPHLARVVAIKTIRRSLLEGKSGSELRERFRREARAEGRLVHGNIITIYEYQEDELGMPFFVMEYVDGQDLKQFLSRGVRFNLEKTLHIVEQVLRALSHSHREGIVHRDIKPANIILLESDQVKIADFGIAKMEESEFTQTGMVMGTPQYISPEQRLGRHVDGRTDLYSVGAVMFELLTGQKASAGLSETKLWHRLKDGAVPDLDIRDAKTERVFTQVVLKALAKDPDDRFQSAEDFLQAITAARPTPPAQDKPRRYLSLVIVSVIALLMLAAVYFYAEPIQRAIESRSGRSPQSPSVEAPVVSSVKLTAQSAEKLQRQLKVARTHLLVGRLITPEGSNAFHSYQLALRIDPENEQAKRGMQAIKEKLLEHIEKLIRAGESNQAGRQLDHALKLFPGDRALVALKEEIG